LHKTKSFDISKQMVYRAYKLIKANKGAAGVDDMSLAKFDENMQDNLYKIWNRLASGSYIPPAVKAVEIPKKAGGTRTLGVPTVADRIAQMVVKTSFEAKVDKHFLQDSYAYRPGKSAHGALEVTMKRCWEKDWVLEFDIKGLFDNIDHGLLMKAVYKHTNCKWELLYIERWLKAPIHRVNGQTGSRQCGVPQGGVISPLLSNLFLHYAFDYWMTTKFPDNPWCRYADDGVVHCSSKLQAEYIQQKLEKRLKECKLEIHPAKTKIVYCKDSNRRQNHENIQFTFLGYTFKPRKAKSPKGDSFTSFLPAISKQAKQSIYQEVKRWRLLWMTNSSMVDIAEKFNPVIRGWLNYYGKYGKKELARVLEHINLHLILWVKRKYKKFKHKHKGAIKYLSNFAAYQSSLFEHWNVGIMPRAG
jgi:RNA-directed DNA polymerase